MLDREPAAAADEPHPLTDPFAEELLQPRRIDRVDEAPIGHLEIAGVRIREQWPVEVRANERERVGNHLRAGVHQTGGVDAGSGDETGDRGQRMVVEQVVADHAAIAGSAGTHPEPYRQARGERRVQSELGPDRVVHHLEHDVIDARVLEDAGEFVECI